MKTAIQQSIEKIKYFQDSTENFAEKRAFAIAVDVLEDYKKTEKKQIVTSVAVNLPIEDLITAVEKAEEYFSKTFKSEEDDTKRES